jgi:heme exporter protein D
MSFDSFSDFLQMGGHGLYVWLSYGMGLIILLMAGVSPMREKRRVLRQLTQQLKRQQNLQQGTPDTDPSKDMRTTTEEIKTTNATTQSSNNEAAQ